MAVKDDLATFVAAVATFDTALAAAGAALATALAAEQTFRTSAAAAGLNPGEWWNLRARVPSQLKKARLDLVGTAETGIDNITGSSALYQAALQARDPAYGP